jgi:YfiH family protein
MILPRPDGSFEWRETRYGKALVCVPLERVAPHLFTTRAWALGQGRHASDDSWTEVSRALGSPDGSLMRLHQVHGRTAVIADRQHPQSGASRPEADIIAASSTESVIAVQVADCVPLLIADTRLGVVAAAHAGWRGLAQGVPRVTVHTLTDAYGSRPADLVAAIGPSVGACCYEVGPDVLRAFTGGGFDNEMTGRWFSRLPVPSSENPSMEGLPSEPRQGQAFFDGWTSAIDQLIAAGIPREQVFCARLCTASHPHVLCSYRREGRAAGRTAGAIKPRLHR